MFFAVLMKEMVSFEVKNRDYFYFYFFTELKPTISLILFIKMTLSTFLVLAVCWTSHMNFVIDLADCRDSVAQR